MTEKAAASSGFHYKKICEKCQAPIIQCHCENEKTISLGICDMCLKNAPLEDRRKPPKLRLCPNK